MSKMKADTWTYLRNPFVGWREILQAPDYLLV